MTVYLPMLVALVALLAGLAIGKAWERYKLRDGQWIDRRKARESPHFIVGLDLVVAIQIDAAIDELSRAAWLDVDALEIHLVLGNLYRERGDIARACREYENVVRDWEHHALQLTEEFASDLTAEQLVGFCRDVLGRLQTVNNRL